MFVAEISFTRTIVTTIKIWLKQWQNFFVLFKEGLIHKFSYFLNSQFFMMTWGKPVASDWLNDWTRKNGEKNQDPLSPY